MFEITADLMFFKELNEKVRNQSEKDVVINNCLGQRFIGSGLSDKTITINGTPGNALGAYLNGADIVVNGNAQDATGDTMNEGVITINGNAGDATGYAMRGGKIFVKENSGYRTGIHMKAYKEKHPVLVVGGEAGSFLGEYQAGGFIIVLGLNSNGKPPIGYFCGTGMHGGKMFLRCDSHPAGLPKQVECKEADENDLNAIKSYVNEFCDKFGNDYEKIMQSKFFVLTPNTKNPYKQLYTQN